METPEALTLPQCTRPQKLTDCIPWSPATQIPPSNPVPRLFLPCMPGSWAGFRGHRMKSHAMLSGCFTVDPSPHVPAGTKYLFKRTVYTFLLLSTLSI